MSYTDRKRQIKKYAKKNNLTKIKYSQISKTPNLLKPQKYSNSNQKTNLYEEELKCLQECFIPKNLLFREKEETKIKDFIRSGIEKEGNQVCLYITGMPGLGKTACMFKAIKKVLIETGNEADFYYINSLKLRNPSQFYTQFWLDLTNIKISSSKKANLYLENYFKEKKLPFKTKKNDNLIKKLEKVKILVIDEIDFLYTKNQNVFYNIFDWQHYPYSKLIVISIANTLDFPETILSKIQSRMGKLNLIFKTYIHSEIKQIIQNRLKNSKLFSSKAIEYISKKTASYSADIRKSLQICRSAIHKFINYNKTIIIKMEYIDIEFMTKIFEEEFTKPIIFFIKNISEISKIFFIGLLYEYHNKSSKEIDRYNLFKRVNNLLFTMDRGVMKFGVFCLMVEKCVGCKIISVSQEIQGRQKIFLMCDPDDLAFGLSDDGLFQKFGHLKSVLD